MRAAVCLSLLALLSVSCGDGDAHASVSVSITRDRSPELPLAAIAVPPGAPPARASPASAVPAPILSLPPSPAPARAAEPSEPSEPGGASEGVPRIYAKTRFIWIRSAPDWGSQWIGYLWHGESVALRSPKIVYGRGCNTWYAVVPRGYVCVDGRRATLDGNDPEYVALREHAPAYGTATPHHYASSLGAERYARLPEPEEERIREPGLRQHLERVAFAKVGGVRDPMLEGVDLTPAPTEAVDFASLPVQIQIQRHAFRRDSTVAYVDEYLHGGRSFLLTSDFAWVPKDRVRPYTPSAFRGIHLGDGGQKFPLALFRNHDRPAFHRTEAGPFTPAAETFPRLGWVGLTGRSEYRYPDSYLETTRDGLWVLRNDAVVPELATHTPWGTKLRSGAPSSPSPRGRGTWVESSVYGGWLVAYEDTTPVFVTLTAPGRGGVAKPPQDPTKTSATPTGRFVVTGKFVTATMDGPADVSHSDVPWVQNFSGPHAIHAAYWHDAWGERVSGGCVNVSPADGRFLFDWSEPAVPEGWHGVRWEPGLENATLVLIRP